MTNMTKDKGPVFALVVFLLFIQIIGQTFGEIHRAKAIKAKPQARPRTDFFTDSENGVVNKLSEKTMDATESTDGQIFFNQERKEAWIYSLCCSVLVGLSGIFPLLVIPIEAGPALKHGSAAKKLKLLLSFAVGGLLGDVFLHLLPEAWAHASSSGAEGHNDHTHIGLWVLTGILTFLILEKIFAGEDEFELMESDEDEVSKEKITTTNLTSSTQVRQRQVGDGKTQNGDVNDNKKSIPNGSAAVEKPEKKKKENIKVSGYLNLMANCIDNFTHGLAVAGSFLVSPKVGALTTFAILIHEIPHEVGDFAILLKSGFDRWRAAKAQLMTASGGILGAIFALSADSAKAAGDQTAWILPFTSGGFLYIALVTVVPDLLNEKSLKESIKQIACLLAGIFAMLMVTWLVE